MILNLRIVPARILFRGDCRGGVPQTEEKKAAFGS